MATDFIYPTSAELMMIERDKLPRLTAQRPAFDIMPMKNLDSHVLMYEQLENIRGLLQVRGLGGDPFRVLELGAGIKYVEPGVYGEFRRISELDLTARRPFGAPIGTPIRIDDLVMAAQEQLLQRRLDRMEQIIWNLLIYGTFSALGPIGQVLHTDTYTTQSQTFVSWSTAATATPLADLRAVQVGSRGHSVSFGGNARIYMNRVTSNTFLANTNANDIGGKRQAGLASITSVGDVNRILTGEDLPQIVVYDEGYFDDAGTFQLFIPNGRAVVVGVRQSGTPVGNFQLTRNANNLDMAPGAYSKIIDRGEDTVPRTIEVHSGLNGGPVLYHPSSVYSIIV